MDMSFPLCWRVQRPSCRMWFSMLLMLFLHDWKRVVADSRYLIGLGSYDITGPAADVNMMGYANIEQIASGIHFRLQARTFIVAEPDGKRVAFVNLDACMASQIVTIKVLERLEARYGDLYNEQNVAISGIHTHAGPGGYLQYIIYIITSLGFVRQSFDVIVDGIEKSIVQAHENLRPGSLFVNQGKKEDPYCPCLHYRPTMIHEILLAWRVIGNCDDFVGTINVGNSLFQMIGWVYTRLPLRQNTLGRGELLDASINRSPSAYINNPSEERSQYKYDVDKEMTLLKFVDDEWGPVGSFNWFATHGTSMSRTNSLISGDNKGAAARFMEDWAKSSVFPEGIELMRSNEIPRRVSNIIPGMHENYDELSRTAASFQTSGGRPATRSMSVRRRVRRVLKQSDRPEFVSAFCQSNCGDVSPNVLGTFCIDTGLPCDFNHSTCGGKNELCYGHGPGYPDEFESTRIIGERQFRRAVELFSEASEQVRVGVDYRHTYLDFSKLNVTVPSNGGTDEVFGTCPAAMGFAFAAGTTDGPGAFDFRQGDDKGNPFWRLVRDMLKSPSKEQIKCQHPKPILLDTGEMIKPYDWAPSVLPIQILRIGQLVILCVPGEFTTMAGRRLRDAVKTVLTGGNNREFDGNVRVVIAGLTNSYSQYVTTFEEYQIQRYEGASTLFGPHTLSAYIQEFKKLAAALVSNLSVDPGSQPPDLLDKQIGFLTPVVMDSTPIGISFGDVDVDVPENATFKRGEVVRTTFWSACPRNDLLTQGTFALVEALQGRKWMPEYDDDDFCLRFKWSRPWKLSTHSHATIEWWIPETALPGVYRIWHFGASKSLLGSIRHFTGASRAFVVL